MASSQLCFALLCLVFALPLCASQIEDADYYYDYSDGPYGPANWGTLHYEWRLCGEGKSQSPVDIDESLVFLNTSNVLATYYDEATVNVTYDHALEVIRLDGGGSLFWNSEGPYEILNMHWHTPSEHTINGVRFPLEGHIVHVGPDNKILVVGILYECGEEDSLLASILSWNSSIGNISLDDVKSNYYNYMGSLTTPPCSEGLTWIVLEEKYTISTVQLNAVRSYNQGVNARPLQPLNGRKIYKNIQQGFIALKES